MSRVIGSQCHGSSDLSVTGLSVTGLSVTGQCTGLRVSVPGSGSVYRAQSVSVVMNQSVSVVMNQSVSVVMHQSVTRHVTGFTPRTTFTPFYLEYSPIQRRPFQTVS